MNRFLINAAIALYLGMWFVVIGLFTIGYTVDDAFGRWCLDHFGYLLAITFVLVLLGRWFDELEQTQ